MGEANRKSRGRAREWPDAESVRNIIDFHILPPVPAINGARLRELTGDDAISADAQIVLRTFLAKIGDRSFHVGFCLGDGSNFSATGIAVIDRLMIEAQGSLLHIVPVEHEDIAWDLVLRHLRTFNGRLLLFAFPNSDVYDAGVAEIWSSKQVRQFDPDGKQFARLSAAQRGEILAQKAALLNRPPPPKFYPAGEVNQEDAAWIFRFATPAGKTIRIAVWNGRRDYAHELPADITRWVGGGRIAIVQVASPVGIDRRSSLELTYILAKDFDGVVHWAKDNETFQSILRSFVRLDLESVAPPAIPDNWDPEVVIMASND